MEPSSTVGIFNDGTELRISTIRHDDIGDYTCIARNGEGQVSHTARVIIAGGAVIMVSCEMNFEKLSIIHPSLAESSKQSRIPLEDFAQKILIRSNQWRHPNLDAQVFSRSFSLEERENFVIRLFNTLERRRERRRIIDFSSLFSRICDEVNFGSRNQ